MNKILGWILLFFLYSCSEKIDYSTPAQAHIDEYMTLLKKCREEKNNVTPVSKVSPQKVAIKKEKKSAGFNGFEVKSDDMILGDKDSKIVFIEYFSPTCPHCAYYHNHIFPELKKKYIDTKKIAYVSREFIVSKQDLDAAVLARCLGNSDNFFKFTAVILNQQENWAYSNKYREILTNIGQLGGVSPEKYSACLNDNQILEILIANRNIAAKSPKFIGTPTFFINGEQFTGAYTLNALNEFIEKALNKAKT